MPRAWLLHWAVKARLVLDANADHPGLKQATAELQSLLDEAQQSARSGTTGRVSAHLARLAVGGVVPIDVLAMMAAVALYDRDMPAAFAGTVPYRFGIARAVCSLVPRGSMPLRSRTIDAIGTLLIDRYNVIASGVVQAVAKTAADAQRRADAMAEPFSSTTPPPPTQP